MINNATMLYKLDGVNQHYEPRIGYIDYDYIIVDEREVPQYLAQGWGLNVTELYLDAKKPKEIEVKEVSSNDVKNRSKKSESISDDNL